MDDRQHFQTPCKTGINVGHSHPRQKGMKSDKELNVFNGSQQAPKRKLERGKAAGKPPGVVNA